MSSTPTKTPKKYFSGLAYSVGDEDANVELGIAPLNSHILGVCGSGARILPFLSLKPKSLTCVDVSGLQILIAKVRYETLKSFSYAEYCKFWGYDKSISGKDREEMFSSLSFEDKDTAAEFFGKSRWNAPIYYGKFEKSLILISKIVKALLGKEYVRIFDTETLNDQVNFFENKFPWKRFLVIIKILGNASFLNSLLYKGEFPKKNIDGSHYFHFKNVFHKLLNTVPVRESYFLQLVLLGEIRFYNDIPEARLQTFDKMKENLVRCDVSFITGNIFQVITEHKGALDYISLSDVPSFSDLVSGKSFLDALYPSVRPDTLLVYNGFLRRIAPVLNGKYELLNEHFRNITEKDSTKLWEYTVLKAEKNAY